MPSRRGGLIELRELGAEARLGLVREPVRHLALHAVHVDRALAG